jgi:hypothetical protein
VIVVWLLVGLAAAFVLGRGIYIADHRDRNH